MGKEISPETKFIDKEIIKKIFEPITNLLIKHLV
jgi:hypothetical protein